jgi:hypothetical protein
MAQTLRIESGPEALLRTTTRFRVLGAHVTCRTGNTLGLGTGGWMTVGVDRGGLLPVDAPAQDVARLLRRGLVEPVGEVPAEVAAAVAVLDAEAEARRPPVPVQSTRERLSTLLYNAGARNGEFHAELLDAFEALIDERVAAALDGRSGDG